MKIFFFLLLLISLPLSIAQGIGVAPNELVFAEHEFTKQIMLFNPNNHPITYTLHAEKEGILEFVSQGTLDPLSKTPVIIEKNDLEEVPEPFYLHIDAKNPEENSGVVVTARASVRVAFDQGSSEEGPVIQDTLKNDKAQNLYWIYAATLFIVSVIAIAALIIHKKKRKKTKRTQRRKGKRSSLR
ncbi:hypothetical protein J4464_04340 [Candidatus Woesearchaeota archaeon]|nr:hypothetical protein [Candidatus Woesearchaeota archaeon]